MIDMLNHEGFFKKSPSKDSSNSAFVFKSKWSKKVKDIEKNIYRKNSGIKI